jgi:hypothetical protein
MTTYMNQLSEVRSLVKSAPTRLHLQKRQNPGGGRPSWVVALLPQPLSPRKNDQPAKNED